MTTIYQAYGSQTTTISTEANSLANTTAAVSTSQVDNTTNRYTGLDILVTVAAAGANTGFVSVYLIEGQATGTLATYAQLQNARFVGAVQLNGTTTVRKRFSVEGVASFWKAVLYNESGGSLASSSNTVTYQGLSYVDV